MDNGNSQHLPALQCATACPQCAPTPAQPKACALQVTDYLERQNDERNQAKVALRRVEHFYYKTDVVSLAQARLHCGWGKASGACMSKMSPVGLHGRHCDSHTASLGGVELKLAGCHPPACCMSGHILKCQEQGACLYVW